jgi:serine/threonine-protein kinase
VNAAAPSGADLVGAILSRKYRLVRLVGAGAMGAVYATDQMVEGVPAAIKMLLPEFVTDIDILTRFLEEGVTSKRLSHPNIIRVFDAATAEDGSPYIVMELLEGVPLARYTSANEPLPVGQALSITRGVLLGLQAAHATGVVHRDLKPDNVFLSRQPTGQFSVKILDFGIAKVMDIAGGMNSKTRMGVLLGTPAYMSPEQVKDAKEVDARTDLWSAGVLLYEMLTGRSPFPAQNEYARLLAVVNEPAVPVDMEDERLAPLSFFFARALAKRREDRFASAGEMLQALNALLEPSTNGVSPVAPGILAVANQKRDLAQRRLHATLHELAEGSSMLLDKERRVALWAVAALIFVAFLAGLTFGFALARSTM